MNVKTTCEICGKHRECYIDDFYGLICKECGALVHGAMDAKRDIERSRMTMDDNNYKLVGVVGTCKMCGDASVFYCDDHYGWICVECGALVHGGLLDFEAQEWFDVGTLFDGLDDDE